MNSNNLKFSKAKKFKTLLLKKSKIGTQQQTEFVQTRSQVAHNNQKIAEQS